MKDSMRKDRDEPIFAWDREASRLEFANPVSHSLGSHTTLNRPPSISPTDPAQAWFPKDVQSAAQITMALMYGSWLDEWALDKPSI
ncbi:hypothetical protein N7486_008062 [Penicillium sp. IBT 16267x]|nr:hypothetical protein N7486_008062 [Penicillium sp. IBT 16267x]